MRTMILCLAAILAAGAAPAQDEAFYTIGGDAYRAGATVMHAETGTDDLFMAGETVRGTADIGGSAHLAGRRVTMDGAVGGDLYAAGMDVDSRGDVAGDATLMGYSLRTGAVGADLRATGSTIEVAGPVGGSAMLAGDTVTLTGRVEGDAAIAARSLDFGPEATIGGTLTLYEETPGTAEVPERVIPADRVDRREIERWEEGPGRAMRPFSWPRAIAGFLTGVVVIAALASLLAALIPDRLAEMRRRVLARPFGTLWLGFLTQSAVVGSAVLFAMTVIGIFVSPAAIVAALAGGFVGYVVGVYAFGVGLMGIFGRLEPETIGEKALAAGVGALVAGLLALVPLLGWLFVLAVTLAGVGALTELIFRPRFFAEG